MLLCYCVSLNLRINFNFNFKFYNFEINQLGKNSNFKFGREIKKISIKNKNLGKLEWHFLKKRGLFFALQGVFTYIPMY